MLRALKRQGVAIGIASLALFVAVGGPATAAKWVNGKDIKNHSITNKKLKNNTIKSAKIRNKTITAKDVRSGSLKAKQVARGQFAKSVGMVKVKASPTRTTTALSRDHAKRVVLHKAGALTLYAKCFNDGSDTRYEIYLQTSKNGAVMDSRADDLHGGSSSTAFLNKTTPETDRQVEYGYENGNYADSNAADGSDFAVFAPGGSWMRGWSAGFVKHGNLALDNGVYGPGNVCLFSGVVASS